MLQNKIQKDLDIIHPYVCDAYLEIDEKDQSQKKNLVLEAECIDHDQDDLGYDPYLVEILTDLENLRAQSSLALKDDDQITINLH